MDFKSSYVDVGWNPSTLYLTWIITGRRRLLIHRHYTLSGSSQVDVLQDLLSCALHDQQSYILSMKSEGYCHIFFQYDSICLLFFYFQTYPFLEIFFGLMKLTIFTMMMKLLIHPFFKRPSHSIEIVSWLWGYILKVFSQID